RYPTGVCLLEYKGKVISEREEYTSRSKYLFGVSAKKTIDGAGRSNTARYINHSCHPNAEVEIFKGRIWIMAKKKIRAGEEICYDYGREYWDEHIGPRGCRCLKCKTKSPRA
ncbi:MAG: SET domain-containing protein, partial [Candidatus Paceibacterota bacterium]